MYFKDKWKQNEASEEESQYILKEIFLTLKANIIYLTVILVLSLLKVVGWIKSEGN
jgi:hypothetical protein